MKKFPNRRKVLKEVFSDSLSGINSKFSHINSKLSHISKVSDSIRNSLGYYFDSLSDANSLHDCASADRYRDIMSLRPWIVFLGVVCLANLMCLTLLVSKLC